LPAILGQQPSGACYSLVSSVLLSRPLPQLPLLLAVGLYVGRSQGVAAREWLVGGLELSVAYGLLLLAVGLMLEGLSLDGSDARLAASFHGRRLGSSSSGRMASPETQSFCRYWVSGVDSLIYIAASAFAVWVVLEQLFLSHTSSVQHVYVCDCLTT